MNIVFRIHSSELEPLFIHQAKQSGFIGLKGHRTASGLRISIYNACTLEAAKALTQFMQAFRRNMAKSFNRDKVLYLQQ